MNRLRWSDDTRRKEAKQLDDGIGNTLVGVSVADDFILEDAAEQPAPPRLSIEKVEPILFIAIIRPHFVAGLRVNGFCEAQGQNLEEGKDVLGDTETGNLKGSRLP